LVFIEVEPLLGRLQRQIWMDGIGTVPYKTGKMMQRPGGPGLNDDANVHSEPGSDEAMVHVAHGGESWDVGGVLDLFQVGRHIAEDEDFRTVSDVP